MNKAESIKEHVQAQNLCMTCGLCCDGTLFKTAPVDPDERLIELQASGVQIHIENERRRLLLPCAAYENNICKAYYNEKAKICTEYQCKLLKQCFIGKITWDEATEVVHSIQLHKKKLEANLRKVYRISSGESLPSIFQRFIESHGGEADVIAFKKKHTHILLDYVDFHKSLSLYFTEKKKEE